MSISQLCTYPTNQVSSQFALTFGSRLAHMLIPQFSDVVSDEFTRQNVFKFGSYILHITAKSSKKRSPDFLVLLVANSFQKPGNCQIVNFTTNTHTPHIKFPYDLPFHLNLALYINMYINFEMLYLAKLPHRLLMLFTYFSVVLELWTLRIS